MTAKVTYLPGITPPPKHEPPADRIARLEAELAHERACSETFQRIIREMEKRLVRALEAGNG